MTYSKLYGLLAATTGGAALAISLAGVQASAQTADSAQDVAQPQDAVAPKDVQATERDIVVTGSRISRGGFTAPTPVTAVTSEQLTQFSQANVADSLNRLPAFRPEKTPATASFTAINVGGNTVDLRGLGGVRTLVLIDGRRFVPNSVAGTVDLNLIPSLLVARTEVVTGGASAAYGSDAVAGVVNVILDTKLEGLRGNVQYGESQRSDNIEYVASVAGGSSLFGGRGHIVAAVEYVDNRGMKSSLSRKWEVSQRLFPNAGYNIPGAPGYGQPAYINGPNSRGAYGAPGGLIYSGPLFGTQFANDGTPQPFELGKYFGGFAMQGGSGTSNPFGTPYMKAMAPTKHLSLFSHLDFELTDSVKAFAEGSYGSSSGWNYGPALTIFGFGSTSIKRDNPYIPASIQSAMDRTGQTSFKFGKIGDDLGLPVWASKNKVYRFTTGLKGDISSSWKWDAYYQYGKARNEFLGTNLVNSSKLALALDAVAGPGGTIICRSAIANPTTSCRPLNLFGTNNWSQDARNYVFGTATGSVDYTQNVVAANIQGDLFSLPAGPVSVAFGAEYRNDSARGTSDAVSKVGGFIFGNQPAYNGRIGSIGVYEGYLEATAPLLKDQAFAHLLELNGAIRQTHYNTSGSATTWKLGAVYEPTSWLRFRGTRSRDLRAPNIGDLFAPPNSAFRTIVNPFVDPNVNTLVPVAFGGNPDLKPEVANTWTVGGALTPGGSLNGLRFSADYYEVKITDAIGTIPAQTSVTRCHNGVTIFCQYVDVNAVNQITAVRELAANLSKFLLRGVDLELSYIVPLDRLSSGVPGTVSFSSLASYTKDLITVDASGKAINRAGQAGRPTAGQSGVPHWIIYNTINYNVNAFTVAIAHRYIQGGKYDASLVAPGDKGYSPTNENSVDNNRVDGRNYFDVTLKYLIGSRSEQNVELYATVNNLLDTDPPVAFGDSVSTNPTYFDMIGRTFKVGARFRF